MSPDFVAFPKISRFSRGAVVTEKIDGTNAHLPHRRRQAVQEDAGQARRAEG